MVHSRNMYVIEFQTAPLVRAQVYLKILGYSLDVG